MRTPTQIESILEQQNIEWENALKFGKGSPYATLCMHCYGRHKPPRDQICPHEPPTVPLQQRGDK